MNLETFVNAVKKRLPGGGTVEWIASCEIMPIWE